MPQIDLRYGRNSIAFEYDDNVFDVLQTSAEIQPLTDLEIGKALDDPIDSAPLEEIVMPGESVLIVVPDATRQSGSAAPECVREVSSSGVPGRAMCPASPGGHPAAAHQGRQERDTGTRPLAQMGGERQVVPELT